MPRCTWLYVLSCPNEDYMYVGMTYRLVTRLNEHITGHGAEATSTWDYNTIQAIYKIDDIEQHNHSLEDDLTLKIMKGRGESWWKIRGGRWHQTSRREKPQQLIDLKEYPETCCCHYPVVIKISKQGRKYSSCPRRDVDWLQGKISDEYAIAEGECDYFRWFDDDE